MPKRLEMYLIEQIQELKKQGHAKRKVARMLELDKGTVGRYWEVTETERSFASQWANQLDWDYLKEEIHQGIPKKILYEEQQKFNKLPSYQSFCRFLSRHKIGERPPDVTIKQQRNPGESMEVDYSGDGWEIHSSMGEVISVELFAGTLSYSGYTFAEFTLSQTLEDFIGSHTRMFSFFGGISKYIIPDNCKTAVTKPDKYDPRLNRTYLDMCNYYGMAIDPADRGRATHKPNVERSIGIIQQEFFPRIRKKIFTSLMDLNRELKQWLEVLNNRPIRGRGESRSFFFEQEKKVLGTPPSCPYELVYFKKAKVHPDCHFQHEKNYYSVPWHYTGKEIDLKYNKKIVHAYYQCTVIATHSICKGTYHCSTNNDHYPEKKFVDANYHLRTAREQSQQVGPYVHALIERLISQSKHPLKILRKAQGILGLRNSFSNEAMDDACKMAMEFDCLNYYNIKKFAENYTDVQEEILKKTPKRNGQYMYVTEGNENDNPSREN